MSKTDEVYNFIEEYVSINNYPPTVREICEKMKLDSTATAVYHLKKLENSGKIVRNGNKNRAIELTDKSATRGISLPVVGTVAAGVPILAEQDISDRITISENFFVGSNLYVLTVKGDSMIEAGILDGDYVVVSQQSIASNGEIVVCLIDNEATVKRFYRENGFFRLQPENSSMRPIFTERVQILGKVVGLIRNKI